MHKLFGFEANLKPFKAENPEQGMDVFHKLGSGGMIPGFLIGWSAPNSEQIAGDYSRLPYIQYLDDKGCIYGVADRPSWFKQYMTVRPDDLYVEVI